MAQEDSSKDILYLYYSTIAKEVLRSIFRLYVENNIVELMIRNTRYQIPIQLFFTDDIIIFINGSIKGIRKIMELFEKYQKALMVCRLQEI